MLFGMCFYLLVRVSLQIGASSKFLRSFYIGVKSSFKAFFLYRWIFSALFFHRYVLRKMGLWKDAASSDESFVEDATTSGNHHVTDPEGIHSEIQHPNMSPTGDSASENAEVRNINVFLYSKFQM